MIDSIRKWWSQADCRFTALRWALVAGLAVYTALVIGGGASRDVDFADIAPTLAADAAADGLQQGDANALLERFGVSPEGCEDWRLYLSEDMMNVCELLAVKAADADVRDRLESACEARLRRQKDIFRAYGVDQMGQLERAVLWQRGNYLFYGVSDAVDRWEADFLSAIR